MRFAETQEPVDRSLVVIMMMIGILEIDVKSRSEKSSSYFFLPPLYTVQGQL
jgi:hypothetical protein